MSFCVSHRSALDKNIRHLYSGLPSDIRFRSYGSSKSGAIDVHDRVFQKHKRPPERFDTKFQEYVPEYGTRLPRAPAFRSVSPEEAKEISNRLSRPTVMSTIRHQSASSRSGNRSSSRRGRSEMSAEDEDGSEVQGEGLSSREGHGPRKASYRDWSDNESGVYYYEDEARRDSVTDYKNQSMDDTITDQAKQDDNEWMYREDPYSSSQDVLSERSEKNERTISSLSSNHDDDRDKRDTEKDDSSLKIEDKGKKSKTTTQGANNSKSSSQPKRKLNILEQIMQARNTRQRQPFTKTQNVTKDSKRLNRRGNVENRLGYSPYCEPMPYLYLTYGPPHKTRSANLRNKSAPQKRAFNKEAVKQHQATTKTYLQNDAGSRPQTRASSTRQRKEAITYQYRPESRATLSEGPPKRSKSAPLYAERKEQRITNKRPTTQETQKRKTTIKTVGASNKPKPSETHQNNPAGKNKFIKKSTDPSSPRDSSVDSADSVSTPRYESNTQSQEQNSRMSRTESSRSVNRIYRADYETLCKMYSSNLYHENGKRYLSPTEMQKANKRLLKPTTAKRIRDRLRYAPDNDRNLSDPVKVVHEAVEGKQKKNDGRGRIDEGDNEDEYEEEEDEGEEKSVEVKKKEVDKNKSTARKQGQMTKSKNEPKKAPTGVDNKLGLRGRSKRQRKPRTRSNSRSSHSSASPEVDSRKNKGTKKIQNTVTKARSTSRSSSPASRKSSVSLSRSPTPTRQRSRSRSGSRSNRRSRSRSGSSSRHSSPASLKTESKSSTIPAQPNSRSSERKSEDQTSQTEEENSNISRGDKEGENYNNSGASFEDNDENSEIKNSSSYGNDSNTHQHTHDSDSEMKREASISYNSELIERTRLANSPGENQNHEYSVDYKNAGRGDEYQDMNGRGDDDRDEGTKIIVPRLRGEAIESTPSPEASTRSPSPQVTYSVRANVRSQEKTNDIAASASDDSSEDETETGADLTLPTDSSYSELKSYDKEMAKESQINQHDEREIKSPVTNSLSKGAQYYGTSHDGESPRLTPEGLASNHEDPVRNPNEAGQNTPQTQKQYSPHPHETDTVHTNENQVAGSEPAQSSEPTYTENHGTTSQTNDHSPQQFETQYESQREHEPIGYEDERQVIQDSILESQTHSITVTDITRHSMGDKQGSSYPEVNLDAAWKEGT